MTFPHPSVTLGAPRPRRALPALRAQGFTLVELMVSIVIVVVLAAIVFVVANRVKNSSKTAASVNNLRQIGTAAQMVASEFHSVLPVTTWNNPDRGRSLMYWWDPVAEKLYDQSSATGGRVHPWLDGLFRDPGSPAGRRFETDEFRPAKWDEIGYVVWSPNQKGWDRQIRGTRLADLSNASMQPYLTTGSMETGAYAAVTDEGLFKDKVLPYASWHNDRTIVLYCDGRVGTVSQPTFETVAPVMAREDR